MNYVIIIPAFNEAKYLTGLLESVCQQSLLPKQVIIVNDSSTDATLQIGQSFAHQFNFVNVVTIASQSHHQPGTKVINAFLYGYRFVTEPYDFIVKLDADLLLPKHYFKTIAAHFECNPALGIVGGFAYIEKNNVWIKEHLTDTDHVRGAFKAYRNTCYNDIGKLIPAMGWDTADEFIARYKGWQILTDSALKVKHLKPTGARYSFSAALRQGSAFYGLRYGILLTAIASLKLAFLKKQPQLFVGYLSGYFVSLLTRSNRLLSKEQGRFLRKYRWQKIRKKFISA
jgi:glycosyltransferase involved in cell wall biosynthesis